MYKQDLALTNLQCTIKLLEKKKKKENHPLSVAFKILSFIY